jgi:signal transduction histidine kinase
MDAAQGNLSEVLLGVAQTLTARLDLHVVLPTILDQLARLIQFDSASIMLVEGEMLRSVARRSAFDVNTAPLTVRITELAHVREAITTRQPVLIADTDRDERWRRRTGSAKIRCWLGVPLIANEQVVGLLNISYHTPDHFDAGTVQTVRAFAAFAAIALNNAALHQRLYDELAERARIEVELRQERALLAARVAEQTSALRSANEEMAQAARMKDEFLAAMSHELHTPLNTVISMTDLLSEDAYGLLNEQQRRALAAISANSRHLLGVIRDVLDVARIESGKLPLVAQPVDVDQLCRACLRQIAAAEKGQSVAYTITPEAATLVADERRLRQILLNLLGNAVKFTAEGGAIGLDVAIEDERDCLALTVWDTGIGIDDSDLHRLFRPFVQLDSSLSRRYEGSGLGLTIAHRLAALHGGSLAVTSRKGEGSRFTVRIPRHAVLETGGADEEAAAARLHPFALILTGLEHVGDLLAYDLCAAGYRVEVMLQSTEGLPVSERPDLVLLNSHLPAPNLLQTLYNIRKSELLNTAPIAVLATLHLPGDREAALATGAAVYAIKPLSSQEFAELHLLSARGEQVRHPLHPQFLTEAAYLAADNSQTRSIVEEDQ